MRDLARLAVGLEPGELDHGVEAPVGKERGGLVDTSQVEGMALDACPGELLKPREHRRVWSARPSVIMCGHFPAGVKTFTKNSIDGETRGEWYLRQMLGSANITGSTPMHIATGHLSYQIEHHLFPDMPSRRYPEIAPRIQALFAE